MTAPRITLEDSRGGVQSLRCLGWPDGARMHWVRMVGGKPEVVTATLALEWSLLVAPDKAECVVALDSSTPWEGFVEGEGGQELLLDANEDALEEWADTFQQEVNKALGDSAALTPFADLHGHEVEAARAWLGLGRNRRTATGALFRDGTGTDATAGEEALAAHVRNEILEQAERNSQRRAVVEYERAGGVLETEPCAGNEAWRPGVSVEVLSESTAPGEPASAREAQEAFRDLGRDRYINPRDPWDQ